jgi:hypothetical protein
MEYCHMHLKLLRRQWAALILVLSFAAVSFALSFSTTAWATALEDTGNSDPAATLAGPPIPGVSIAPTAMTVRTPSEPVQISELPSSPYLAGGDNQQFRQKMGLVVGYIQNYNRRLASEDTMNIAQAIVQFSERYSIDYRLLASLIAIESGFRRDAVSSSGAIGMGQLKPGTAHWLGVVDPYNPVDNIAGTARFLSWLMQRYNGKLEFALSAYYQGPGFVDKNGIAPVCMPYLEKVNRALGPLM